MTANYKSFAIPHSSSIPEGRQRSLEGPKNASKCVICIKTLIPFNNARVHGSFEQSLRKTPCKDWRLTWSISAPALKPYEHSQLPRDEIDIRLSVKHKGGYGWEIGRPLISISCPRLIVDMRLQDTSQLDCCCCGCGGSKKEFWRIFCQRPA